MLTTDEFNKITSTITELGLTYTHNKRVLRVISMYTGIKTIESSNLDSEVNQLKKDIERLKEIVHLKKEIKRLKELEKEEE